NYWSASAASQTPVTPACIAGTQGGAAITTLYAHFKLATASTTTTLASSANPSVFNQSVTFTATVAATPSTPAPTGTVTFKDNGNSIGVGTLSTSGGVTTATLTTSTLSVSTHPITADYAGVSGSFAPS